MQHLQHDVIIFHDNNDNFDDNSVDHEDYHNDDDNLNSATEWNTFKMISMIFNEDFQWQIPDEQNADYKDYHNDEDKRVDLL